MIQRFLLLILALSIITANPASVEPRPYKKRGFGRIGARCPECGGPLSHGRNGNPAFRRGPPPCTKPTALAQRAANDDARRRLERLRAKHEAWERIARLKAAASRTTSTENDSETCDPGQQARSLPIDPASLANHQTFKGGP
jgi:hypothetical protein